MMHKEKYEVTPEPRTTLSNRLTSFYGNIRSHLLGGVLTGRRSVYEVSDADLAEGEDGLTAFRQETDGKEGKKNVVKFQRTTSEVLLKPKSVELQRSLNRQAHKTSLYEIPNLILRRGQSFDISITFDRTFSEADDEIVLRFVTGRQPMQSKNTVIPVTKVRNLQQGEWGYQITSTEDKKVSLKICTGSSCVVGRYTVYIDTVHRNNEKREEKYRYTHPDDIFIIFNPWCSADTVFLEDENEREEYILNETGRIWMGTVGKFSVRPWNFAQFDDVCLMAALAMLEKSELADSARGDPLLVVRAVSGVINNNEHDGGILVGNYSGKYDDGVAPYAWNGSSAILEEYLKKRKGVKYGQCWTFAAVATTALRALGIPTRCVTNFISAHDSDFSTQIDNFWSPDNKPRKRLNDTIWDFHVWNESWFKRPDLPDGYDGWQAFDPTPQECNEGVFTCGPASVKAIKQGKLYLGFDTRFLFAEVNGDRIHWTIDSEGNMEAIAEEKSIVGRFLSTKAVNTISREDVTSSYRYAEGTSELEEAIKLAKKLCARKEVKIVSPSADDIEFSYNGSVQKNGDIDVEVKMKNIGKESRVVDIYITAIATKYTAVPSNDLKDSLAASVLEPGAENETKLSLKASDYISSIDTDSHVNIYIIANVKETNQKYICREIIRCERPNLELKTEGNATVGKPFDVIVKLVNTLSIPLTGGYINLEGPGMQKVSAVKIKKPINPNEEIRETIQIKPRRAGRREIIANFHCKQLCDVTGVTEVEISGEPSKS